MKRIFIILLLCLSALAVSAEPETTVQGKSDGTATVTITTNGPEPKKYQISQNALQYFMLLAVEENIAAETQGMPAAMRFQKSEEEVAVYQAALGMTAEQVTELAKKRAEHDESMNAAGMDMVDTLVRFDDLSPEELSEFDKKFRTLLQQNSAEEQARLVETLTPAQIQRMQELELVLPSATAQMLGNGAEMLMNINAYQALELSDEQKKVLEGIQKEGSKEMVDFTKVFFREYLQMLKDGKEPSEEELKAKLEQGKAMKARIKAKIHALLTKEQLAKLEKILTDWPKKLESIRADWKLKQENKKPEDDSWRNAWKPGDPVPEGAVPPKIRKPFPF